MSTQRLILNIVNSGEKVFRTEGSDNISEEYIDVWYLSLDQDAATVERARTFLDRKEIERAERFIHEKDSIRNILAHGLLRSLLSKICGQHPEQLRFEFGKFKKPYLADHRNIHFNLSDTKDAVIIAITKGQELGVDIETMTRRVNHLAVADHYFTENEKKTIFNDKNEGKRKFLELWTRKEALLKASGVGIMDDLKLIDVSKKKIELDIVHPEFQRMAAPEYNIESFYSGKDHLISVASAAPIQRIRTHSAEGRL